MTKLNTKPTINPAEELQTRIQFLKDYALASNTQGFVLGISGGQDSALAGYIAQTAVNELTTETGKPYKFVALLLPYGTQKDAHEAQYIAEQFIKADITETFNIKPTVDAFTATYNTIHPEDNLKDYHKGNVKARARMLTQYAYAGENNLLVVGTDNLPENLMGYFTKFGDGGADILPLFGLNKRQEKEILTLVGAPSFVLTKAPTADLLDNAPGQADETELGITYNELDDYLEGKKITPEITAKIEHHHLITEHKRQPPVTPHDTWWK